MNTHTCSFLNTMPKYIHTNKIYIYIYIIFTEIKRIPHKSLSHLSSLSRCHFFLNLSYLIRVFTANLVCKFSDFAKKLLKFLKDKNPYFPAYIYIYIYIYILSKNDIINIMKQKHDSLWC